jgi:hypothetical protein
MRSEHYAIPSGKTWADWEAINGELAFFNDREVIDMANENIADFADEPFGHKGQPPKTAEEAWSIIDKMWEGDPGGSGWHKRIPTGTGWLTLRFGEDEFGMPEVSFNPGQPPKGTKMEMPG